MHGQADCAKIETKTGEKQRRKERCRETEPEWDQNRAERDREWVNYRYQGRHRDQRKFKETERRRDNQKKNNNNEASGDRPRDWERETWPRKKKQEEPRELAPPPSLSSSLNHYQKTIDSEAEMVRETSQRNKEIRRQRNTQSKVKWRNNDLSFTGCVYEMESGSFYT